jgi:hypothetical protein
MPLRVGSLVDAKHINKATMQNRMKRPDAAPTTKIAYEVS